MTATALRLPRRRLRRAGVASLAAFSAAAVGAGLGRGLVTTYLPVLLDRIRDAPGLIGTVMLVNTFAGFVVPLWIGLWSDSLRSRGMGRTVPFIVGGSVVAAGGLLAVALGHTSSYAALALFAAVVYVGLNAITTAHRALIPEAFGERERAGATGAEELAMLGGALVGVVAGGALLELAGWAPFALGAVALPLLALPTMRRMRGRETGRSSGHRYRAPLRYYLRAARRPGARLILAGQLFWVLGYVGLAPFFVLYAGEELNLRPAVAAVLLGAFGLVTGASVLGAGAVSPGRQTQSLLLGVLLMGGGLLGVASTTSLRLVAPALLAAAVGFGLVTTLGFATFASYIPPGEEGAYSALFFSVRSISSAVAVPAAGWTIAFSGTYRALFVFGGAVTLLALVPLSALGRSTPRRFRRPSRRGVLLPLGALTLATVAGLVVARTVAATRLARVDEVLFDAAFALGSTPRWLDAVLVDPHIENYVALTLVAAVAAVAWRREELTAVLGLVPFAGLVSFGVVRLLWASWDRARPEEVLGIDPANGHVWASYPSFPSGHVVVTVALVAATTSRIRWLAALLWPYAALIALTRVLYGAHFPTDVLLAAILGYVSARAVASLLAEVGFVPTAWQPTFDRAVVAAVRRAATPARVKNAARIWTAAAIASFGLLAVAVGPPQAPEGGVLPTRNEEAVQLALLALAAVGTAVSMYRVIPGAAVLLLAGVGLGVLAAVEYAPLFAFGACLAFFVPGLMLLGARLHGPRALAAAAVAAVTLLAAGGAAAFELHARAYGPTHPESALRAQPVQLVRWIWAGGVTPGSVRATAKLDRDTSARLLVSRSPSLIHAVRSAPRTADHDRNDRIVSFQVRGLSPATRYFYAVEAGGVPDRSRLSRFRTPPVGRASFTIAFGGCARVGSNGAVFDAIRAVDPLLFLIVGDFFYGNVARDDPEEFRNLYERALAQPAQSALYRSTSVAYVWDDHDFGGNDADGTSPSREAAQRVYRTLVPSYALPGGRETGPIYQAFTIGRVRFLLTDTRSERTPSSAPDDRRKTMLGSRQKAWLKRELSQANGRYPLIVWVNSVPWIGPASPGADDWSGYATERRELADYISARRIRGLVMVSGDAHMVAIDDGKHSDYSTRGDAGFPVVHAAALDRRGDLKGGPYSEGAYPGSGQFGTLTVRDLGSRLDVELAGWRYTGRRIVSHRFSVEAQP